MMNDSQRDASTPWRRKGRRILGDGWTATIHLQGIQRSEAEGDAIATLIHRAPELRACLAALLELLDREYVGHGGPAEADRQNDEMAAARRLLGEVEES